MARREGPSDWQAPRTLSSGPGWPGEPLRVTAIEFEHSPGRGNPRFTADGSAFDVFVDYQLGGARAFLGIEVKYVENLAVREAQHRPRYDEIARDMGIFESDRLPRLRVRPLEQFWRDHLLACSLLLDPGSGYDRGQLHRAVSHRQPHRELGRGQLPLVSARHGDVRDVDVGGGDGCAEPRRSW